MFSSSGFSSQFWRVGQGRAPLFPTECLPKNQQLHVKIYTHVAKGSTSSSSKFLCSLKAKDGIVNLFLSCWNAVYLSQTVEELKKRGEVVPEEYLPHITPLGWEHINLIGQYSFSHQSSRSLNNLRPLQLPEQENQETQENAEEDRGVPSHS